MLKKTLTPGRALAALSLLLSLPLAAQNLKPIELPQPQKQGGKPLLETLAKRRSTRSFGTEKLSAQMLSNLLWAAFGVSDPSGKRTAPSASNMQEVDIYVALADGLYVYNAKAHRLQPVLAGDLRAATGSQDFVAHVPINLVYVADYSKMGQRSPEQKMFYSAVDTGFIAENVYLFCASEGLGVVVRGLVDREALAKKMNLRPDQKVILSQSIGYPGK